MEQAQPAVRLARMTREDVPRVHELERQCFSLPWDLAAYYGELRNPSSYYQVAWLDDRLVGYGGMWLVGDEAHVVTIAVDHGARRHGIGRRLMEALIAEAARRDIVEITLEVRVGNVPARALYESLGFQVVAIRPRYYPDNQEDAAVMARAME